MRKRKKMRTMLVLFSALACLFLSLIFGFFFIADQGADLKKRTITEMQTTVKKSSDMLLFHMQEMSRIVRVMRMQNEVEPFFEKGNTLEKLEICVDIYAEQNLIERQIPFIERCVLFHDKDAYMLDYYPKTKQEFDHLKDLYVSKNLSFLNTDQERTVVLNGKYLEIYFKMYDHQMHDFCNMMFAINTEAMSNLLSFQSSYEECNISFSFKEKNVYTMKKKEINGKHIAYSAQMPFELTLHTNIAYSEVSKVITPYIMSLVFVFLLFVLLNTLFISYSIFFITKPLNIVAKKIKAFGAGDYTTTLSLYKWEEFEDIEQQFNKMTSTIRRLLTEVYDNKLIAQETEIKFLQAQMNPHFMFNVLTMISMTAKKNKDEEVYTLIRSFARLTRGKVFKKTDLMITMHEELELVHYYLSLQQHRYMGKFDYVIECEDDLRQMKIPRLTIEPMAENAFLHGIEPLKEKGNILVKVTRQKDEVHILIKDNGVGFDPEMHTEGVGISNTKKMLKNLYVDKGKMEIESAIDKGTSVWITIPWKGEYADDESYIGG